MSVVLTDYPEPGVLRILINRPGARNAIDGDTRNALLDAITSAQTDLGTRAIVLGGTEHVFSSGGDLPSMITLDQAGAKARMEHGHQIVSLLWHFPKPVVSAVEGFAVGAGAGLALLGDSILMGRSAFFSFPFMKLGLIPDWGLMETLPQRIGKTDANRLFITAAKVRAEEALGLKLADQILDDGQVMAGAIEQATMMAKLPLGAFSRLKARMRADTSPNNLGLEYEANAQVQCLRSKDFTEGYKAFQEKRRPDFKDPA